MDMMVGVIPVRLSDEELVHTVCDALESIYDIQTVLEDPQRAPWHSYDYSRDQYSAAGFTEIAEYGLHSKNIVVTDLDLFSYPLNFVFGQAHLAGRASVISTYRLNPDFYECDGGQPSISDEMYEHMYRERVAKEAVHEVGHMLGLRHCTNNRCVMSFSPTIAEVDIKDKYLCPHCMAMAVVTLSII